MLVNHLTVWKTSPRQRAGKVIIDRSTRARVQALSDQYHFNIDLDAPVSDLSVA
jgi:ABC-type uncharacterized transport system ATPase subunit